MLPTRVKDFLIAKNDIEIIFGIFSVINYPLFYFAFNYNNLSFNEDLIFRVIATILAIPLILKKHWPHNLVKYFKIYWLTTVTFCIPFFGTYFVLINNFSKGWDNNILLGLFLLILVLKWSEFIYSLIIGVVFAIIFHVLFIGEIHIDQAIYNINILNMVWVLVTSWVFLIKKESIVKERINTLTAVNAQISHEIRTPLTAIALNMKSIGVLLEKININEQSDLKKQISSHIEHSQQILKNTFDLLEINLMKTKYFNTCTFAIFSIEDCINEAISSYPNKQKYDNIIDINITNFQLHGCKLLLIHIIYNLLQNSIFAIELANKGHIIISSMTKLNENILIFRDNASGINRNVYIKLFEQFNSNKKYGTGLGLYFCKKAMEAMGGSISCKSVEGEYTEFTLRFLKIKDEIDK